MGFMCQLKLSLEIQDGVITAKTNQIREKPSFPYFYDPGKYISWTRASPGYRAQTSGSYWKNAWQK